MPDQTKTLKGFLTQTVPQSVSTSIMVGAVTMCVLAIFRLVL
jgi:hypothetical protein